MLKHHQDSLQNLIDYYKADRDIISIILAGSIAKGCERTNSDIDAIIVVSDKKYALLVGIFGMHHKKMLI